MPVQQQQVVLVVAEATVVQPGQRLAQADMHLVVVEAHQVI